MTRSVISTVSPGQSIETLTTNSLIGNDADHELRLITVSRPEMFGAAADGVTDDSSALQNAINAGAGGIVQLDGSYRCNATLVISHDRTRLVGAGSVLCGVSNGPLLSFRNVSFCELSSTVFLDGQWQSGATCVELRGALHSKISIRGDRWTTGVRCVATVSAGASQNTAFNELDVVILNGVTGISFQGDGTFFASNNRIRRLVWAGVGSAVSVGINFIAYADNNVTDQAFCNLNYPGSIAVLINSSAPSSDVQVYENHFAYLVAEANVAGTISIKGNRTWQTPGMWPSRITQRLSGSHPPALSVSTQCDLELIECNDGLGNLTGRAGVGTVMIDPTQMALASGSAVPGVGASCPMWVLPRGSTSAVRFSAVVPENWRQCAVTALHVPSVPTGGNISWTLNLSMVQAGSRVDGGTVTAGTCPAGTSAGLVVSSGLASGVTVPTGTKMLWGTLTRNGSSTKDTATADEWLIALLVTRTL